MIFHGFQKMTLLDYPGKVACTLFTGGCNLRCPFCHNAPLVTGLDVSEETTQGNRFFDDDILSYLRKRRGLLDGVCITGGEPLMHKELSAFIREVRSLGYAVKMDTNGTLPDRLQSLIDGNLIDYVAMDIKNCPEKYPQTVGVADFDCKPIRASVSLLAEGRVDYEFRTTVVKELHTVEDIAKIADWIQGAPRYYLQGFRDSGQLIQPGLEAVPYDTMVRMKDAATSRGLTTFLRGV